MAFPDISPTVLGAFVVSSILGLDNFESTFDNVAVIPAPRTVAWRTPSHGIEPELCALATIVNLLPCASPVAIYVPIRLGALRLGVPED